MRVNIIVLSLINKTKMYYQNSKKSISKIKNENSNKYVLPLNKHTKIIKGTMQSHLNQNNGSIIGVKVGVY